MRLSLDFWFKSKILGTSFKVIPQTENLYFAQKNLTSYHQVTFPKSLNRISLELASSIGSYVMSKSESRRR